MHMPSVRVNVSRLGRFSQLKVRLTKLTRPWLAAMLRLVAARTASSRSLPIPILEVPDCTAAAFSCFLKQVKVSPTDAPIYRVVPLIKDFIFVGLSVCLPR